MFYHGNTITYILVSLSTHANVQIVLNDENKIICSIRDKVREDVTLRVGDKKHGTMLISI